MWSKHSRRIDPISRSAKPFCIQLFENAILEHFRADDRRPGVWLLYVLQRGT